MTRILGLLTLATAILAFDASTSQACGARPTVSNDNYHYFVHAGGCSRSLHLAASCTCPDEAAYLAEQLSETNLHCWVSTTPDTYTSFFNDKQ